MAANSGMLEQRRQNRVSANPGRRADPVGRGPLARLVEQHQVALDDIGGMFLGRRVQARQRRDRQHVVRIDEDEVTPAGPLQAEVAGDADAGILPALDQLEYLRVRADEAAAGFGAAVGRGVVDQQRLDAAGEILRDDTLQAVGEVARDIVNRQDQRNVGRRGVAHGGGVASAGSPVSSRASISGSRTPTNMIADLPSK